LPRENWEHKDGRWLLRPSEISVVESDGFLLIFVGNRPVNARYSGALGARMSASEMANAKRKALFGASRVRLVQ
jgi:hypothetical protein